MKGVSASLSDSDCQCIVEAIFSNSSSAAAIMSSFSSGGVRRRLKKQDCITAPVLAVEEKQLNFLYPQQCLNHIHVR